MEPYDVGTVWDWRRGKQFVNSLYGYRFPLLITIYIMRVQDLLITTITAYTAIAISTIAVSNRATTSSTMTTQWKSGRASSGASPSAYYVSTLGFFLRSTRAPV
jgi:hypothetical protein